MALWDNYDPMQESGAQIQKGRHMLDLVKVEQMLTRNGDKEKLAFEFKIDGVHKLYHNIVEGDYFSGNINSFTDAFRIPRGNKEIHRWPGRKGLAYLDLQEPRKDANGNVIDPNQKLYMEIKYFIKPDDASDTYRRPSATPPSVPPSTGGYRAPPRQPEYSAPPYQGSQPDFVEDIPF
jgi:hypothetical protein